MVSACSAKCKMLKMKNIIKYYRLQALRRLNKPFFSSSHSTYSFFNDYILISITF